MMKRSVWIAVLFTFCSGQRLSAQTMVDWAVPALSTNKPQTEEEAKYGQEHGRKLPEPEILQPTLDASLQSYQPRHDKALAATFKAAASDVLPGLVKAWIAAFQHYYPDVKIEVSPPYAGSLGAKELVNGAIDMVFVSRELKPDDVTDFKAKFGYDPTSVPICGGSYRHFGFLDAVGFFVNKENPIERLGFDQLDGILSTTHHRGTSITKWGQLGLSGEWADKPVHIYGIKPWNGFEEFVRQRVLSMPNKRGEWREEISFDKVVFPVAGRVAQDRYGIGYSGIAYIDAGVKLIALREKADGPYYPPTYENVARAVYPLSRLVFLNLNKAPGKPLNPALEEFVRFIVSKEGQQIVLNQAIYLPLRERQAVTSRSLIGDQSSAQAGGVIRVLGNYHMGTLLNYWEEGFRKHHPEVRFEEKLLGTANAIAGLYLETADVALMGREIIPMESIAYRRVFRVDPLEIAVATASFNVPLETFAFAIFVNHDNPIDKLTMKQLQSIFGCNGARTWGELGLTGEWAARPIHLHGYETNSGLGYFFEQHALAGSHLWNCNLHEYANQYAPDGKLLANAGDLMVREVGQDPGAIAFCGFGHKTPQVKALALAASESGPFVELTKANVASRTYPLTRTVYFYVNSSAGTNVREFLRYILSPDGQREVERQDIYLPLTAAAARQQLQKLSN
jgi:phosphate transport system substrate-binding protein